MKLLKIPVIEQTTVESYTTTFWFLKVRRKVQYIDAGELAVNIDAIARVFKNMDGVFVLSMNDSSSIYLRPEIFAKVAKHFGKIAEIKYDHCMCIACKDGVLHKSDCAVHNMPAYPNGPCNCGVTK